MTHFAYPNAKTRETKFLGCGRFIALDAPLDGYHVAEPQIGNLTKVTTAASLLAPESRESERILYERDDGGQAFFGDSQDFAYLLGLISRSRQVALPQISGDIWCTGSLEFADGMHPFLSAVKPDGFDLKLQAFLADDQPDALFLLPDANIQPRHDALLRNANITAQSLKQFRAHGATLSSGRKTILKILGHELSELIELLFDAPGYAQAAAFPMQSPYRGLSAFQEADADLFFGRDREIERIIEVLRTKRFAALLGASGTGKSSIVYAGVIPRLRHDATWHVIAFRPNVNPFLSAAAAFARLLSPNAEDIEFIEQEGAFGFDDAFRRIAAQYPQTPVLLIIDQFEELYTLCCDDELRRRFLDELSSLMQPQTSAHCLLTMRADFLGKALNDATFARLAQDRSVWLGAMGRDELRETIEKPAQAFGVALEERLTDRILDAVGTHSGNLPLLEFALTEMWRQQADLSEHASPSRAMLTHAAYDRIGGVEQALAQYAERIYHALSSEEQTAAQNIFLQLVQPGQGTEDTRRIAAPADIGRANWPVVAKLADARLLVTNRAKGDASEKTVEVVHEALLARWQRLRDWMERDREFRVWQERLRSVMPPSDAISNRAYSFLHGTPLLDAEDWLARRGNDLGERERAFILASARQRNAAQRKKRLGRTLFMVGAVALAGIFGWLWRNAERQRLTAIAQREIAEEKTFEALSASAMALYLSHDDLEAVMAMIKAANMVETFRLDEDVRTMIFTKFDEILHHIRERVRLEHHQASVTTIAYHPATQRLLSGDADGVIHLVNLRDWRIERTFRAPAGMVLSVAFSPDGELFAAGTSEGTVMIWETNNDAPLFSQSLHNGPAHQIAFHPKERLLASAGEDGSVALWNLRAPPAQPPLLLRAHTTSALAVAFSADGALFATGGGDGSIAVWVTATGQRHATFQEPSGGIQRVKFFRNDAALAIGLDNGMIALRNLADGTVAQRFQAHAEFVGALDINADGTLLLSGGGDKTLKLWTLPDAKAVAVLAGHADAVYAAQFAEDRGELLSGGWDRTVRVWKMTTASSQATSANDIIAFGCEWIRDALVADQSPSHDEHRRICRDM